MHKSWEPTIGIQSQEPLLFLLVCPDITAGGSCEFLEREYERVSSFTSSLL